MALGDSCCISVCYWILSILTWCSILWFVLPFFIDEEYEAELVSHVFLAFVITVYYVIEFCSSSSKYLCNRTEDSSIYSYMERMFYTPLHKVMKISCYHYEERTYTDSDSDGNSSTKTEIVEVTTHEASERYFYTSWRDISGKFDLNISVPLAKHERPFVMLHLRLAMKRACDGTKSDFDNQKASFIRRNDRDVRYHFKERLEIEGYKEFNLVRVSDHRPVCLHFGWFLLFTLITMAELYKLYMDHFCRTQTFTIRKVVSTREDLNSPINAEKYIPFAPAIIYKGETKSYYGPMVLAEDELTVPPPDMKISAPLLQ